MKSFYIVIEDLESERIDAKYYFNTYDNARNYVDKVIEERKDVFVNYDDVVVFDNDDALYISKVIKYN